MRNQDIQGKRMFMIYEAVITETRGQLSEVQQQQGEERSFTTDAVLALQTSPLPEVTILTMTTAAVAGLLLKYLHSKKAHSLHVTSPRGIRQSADSRNTEQINVAVTL
jgi:hypothetical protein